SGACGYSPAAVVVLAVIRRRLQAKVVKDLSRPAGKLRPQVHGQTLKYNMKLRECRGISLEELKDGRIGYEEFQVRMKEGTDWRKVSLGKCLLPYRSSEAYIANDTLSTLHLQLTTYNLQRKPEGDDDYILFSTDGLPGPVYWLIKQVKLIANASLHNKNAAVRVVSHTRLESYECHLLKLSYLLQLCPLLEHGVNVNANSLHHGVLDTNVARHDDGFIVVEFPVILAAVNKNEKQQLERPLNACKGIPQVPRV
ncbi:60S ribosomal protein L13-1-like protein, partial [Tanacetum coccineum]